MPFSICDLPGDKQDPSYVQARRLGVLANRGRRDQTTVP
jgi:hypothetical protein